MSGEATVSRVTEAVETGSIIAVYRRTFARIKISRSVCGRGHAGASETCSMI
jgi:hypothetical protein